MALHTTGSPRSPLARLVLFMVCLSIAGSFIAGIHYVAVDKPAQYAAAHPPMNSETREITYDYCNDVGSSLWAMFLAVMSFGRCDPFGKQVCCH